MTPSFPTRRASDLEEVLHGVREPRHFLQAEHPAGALEGVRYAEDLRDEVLGGPVLLQAHDLLIERLDEGFRLLQEDPQVVRTDIDVAHAGASLLRDLTANPTSRRVA